MKQSFFKLIPLIHNAIINPLQIFDINEYLSIIQEDLNIIKEMVNQPSLSFDQSQKIKTPKLFSTAASRNIVYKPILSHLS